jgi:hypothetical protein
VLQDDSTTLFAKTLCTESPEFAAAMKYRLHTDTLAEILHRKCKSGAEVVSKISQVATKYKSWHSFYGSDVRKIAEHIFGPINNCGLYIDHDTKLLVSKPTGKYNLLSIKYMKNVKKTCQISNYFALKYFFIIYDYLISRHNRRRCSFHPYAHG